MRPSDRKVVLGSQPLPARPRARAPICEDCGEGDAAACCECCGQELCASCWGAGDEALCGGCRGGAWEEAARDEEIAVGLTAALDGVLGRAS